LALDFAVTSGLRNVPGTIQDGSSATATYEDFKRLHLDTERLCAQEGFSFCPMVMEASGGAWGASAAKVFNELAKTKSSVSGEPVDLLLSQLYQNLGIILHRENARSVLKRASPLRGDADHVLAAAATLQNNDAEVQ
jgi:hypothetical protein